jgi:type VII secretion protein EccB
LVSRSALASAPRGAPLGLPGAPDSLPAPGQLLGMPWSVCAAASRSLLLVGHPPTGRRPPDGAGILIQAPDRALSLVWRGHRLPIPDPALVRAAFGWAGQPPVPVPTAFFNALQQGADLVAPVIPGTVGAPSRIARHKVGTVIVVPTQGGARQYAVVLAAGLAPISQVQADLLLSDPNQERRLGQTRAVRMSQAEFAAGPAASLPGVSLPATTPALVPPSTVDGAVCATFADESGTAVVSIDVPMPSPTDAVQSRDLPSGRGRGAVPVADLIVVPPGRGALIEAVAAPGGTGGALSLLTDVGLRYPLPTADVPSVLGYGSVRPVRVPAGLVALLPSGTALDPAAARLPAR